MKWGKNNTYFSSWIVTSASSINLLKFHRHSLQIFELVLSSRAELSFWMKNLAYTIELKIVICFAVIFVSWKIIALTTSASTSEKIKQSNNMWLEEVSYELSQTTLLPVMFAERIFINFHYDESYVCTFLTSNLLSSHHLHLAATFSAFSCSFASLTVFVHFCVSSLDDIINGVAGNFFFWVFRLRKQQSMKESEWINNKKKVPVMTCVNIKLFKFHHFPSSLPPPVRLGRRAKVRKNLRVYETSRKRSKFVEKWKRTRENYLLLLVRLGNTLPPHFRLFYLLTLNYYSFQVSAYTHNSVRDGSRKWVEIFSLEPEKLKQHHESLVWNGRARRRRCLSDILQHLFCHN